MSDSRRPVGAVPLCLQAAIASGPTATTCGQAAGIVRGKQGICICIWKMQALSMAVEVRALSVALVYGKGRPI
eukprot:scaffold177654_cov25-Tisochrysis_lutea.AAC.2